MIDPTELRIGNYVDTARGRCKVTNVGLVLIEVEDSKRERISVVPAALKRIRATQRDYCSK